jgi:hypothetical protein
MPLGFAYAYLPNRASNDGETLPARARAPYASIDNWLLSVIGRAQVAQYCRTNVAAASLNCADAT